MITHSALGRPALAGFALFFSTIFAASVNAATVDAQGNVIGSPSPSGAQVGDSISMGLFEIDQYQRSYHSSSDTVSWFGSGEGYGPSSSSSIDGNHTITLDGNEISKFDNPQGIFRRYNSAIRVQDDVNISGSIIDIIRVQADGQDEGCEESPFPEEPLMCGIYYGDYQGSITIHLDSSYFADTATLQIGDVLTALNGNILNEATSVEGIYRSGGTSGEYVFDFTVSGLSAQSSSIPIPAAAWLFGSALFGLVGIRLKRN